MLRDILIAVAASGFRYDDDHRDQHAARQSDQTEPLVLLLRSRKQVGGAHIYKCTRRKRQQPAQSAIIDLVDDRIGYQHTHRSGHGSGQEGRPHSASFPDTSAQQQQVSDNAFGKLVQDHAHGRQNAGEDAYREGDGVNDAVEKGVKSDAEHGDHTDGIILFAWILFADK